MVNINWAEMRIYLDSVRHSGVFLHGATAPVSRFIEPTQLFVTLCQLYGEISSIK